MTGSRKTSGTPTGIGDPERVAQPAGILDGNPPLLAGDADAQGAAGRLQLGQQGADGGVFGRGEPGRDLGLGQIAEDPQQIGDALDAAGLPAGCDPLQLGFDLGEGVGIEQLA